MSFPYSKSSLPNKLFINNEYVDSKGSNKLTLTNPHDGSVIDESVPIANDADVDAAVAAAEAALPAWKKMPNGKRRDIMLKFAELVLANSVPLAELTRVSLGAPYEAFGKFEAGLCAEVCLRHCTQKPF